MLGFPVLLFVLSLLKCFLLMTVSLSFCTSCQTTFQCYVRFETQEGIREWPNRWAKQYWKGLVVGIFCHLKFWATQTVADERPGPCRWDCRCDSSAGLFKWVAVKKLSNFNLKNDGATVIFAVPPCHTIPYGTVPYHTIPYISYHTIGVP